MARVVVTGGAGFVGSHVADAFIKRGDEVLVLDDLSTGHQDNVPERAELERIDITDADAVARAFDTFGPKLVCHLAAQASVRVSVERPEHDLNVNVRGTFVVCEAAQRSKAPVLFASTGGAIYGNGAPLPTPEDYLPQPLSPYGASKLAAESYVGTWGRLYEQPNVVLRLANVYGPGQNPHGEAGVVAIFSERLLLGEPPSLRGDGKPTRDYVHVFDAANAFVAAANGRRAGIYNVGTGRPTSTAKLLALLQEAAKTSLEPTREPLQPGELQTSALDVSRIEADLGWKAELKLEDGLRETFEWYRRSR
jgi:UDP-glucose 4-epimerase